MKISYLRFNLPIELDYENASVESKGTDRRLGFIEALVKKGHKVTIHSPTRQKKDSGDSLSSFFDVDDEEGIIDYSFLDSVEIETGTREMDCDLAIVENAASNTLFSFKDTYNLYPEYPDKSVPFIFRTLDLLDKFCGNVIYFQWDVSLIFPTGEHIGRSAAEFENLSSRNLGAMTFKMKDLFNNKKYKLLTTGSSKKIMEKFEGTKRPNYKLFTSSNDIPVCYSDNIDTQMIPKSFPKNDLVYVGTCDEFRLEQIRKLLGTSSGSIYGKGWNEALLGRGLSRFVLEGQKGSHHDVYEFYNQGYCGLQVPNQRDFECDNMTSRMIQIVRGGAIALVSGYSEGVAEKYVDPEFVVKTSKDVERMVSYVKSLKREERIALNRKQMSKLKKWIDLPWNMILKEF